MSHNFTIEYKTHIPHALSIINIKKHKHIKFGSSKYAWLPWNEKVTHMFYYEKDEIFSMKASLMNIS